MIIRNSGGAYQTYKDVDKITAMDGVPVIAPDATVRVCSLDDDVYCSLIRRPTQGLSASRCALGCTNYTKKKKKKKKKNHRPIVEIFFYENNKTKKNDVVTGAAVGERKDRAMWAGG